ncbi:nuclear-interacting partner of ALK, partial [Trifolium pratense]
KRGFQSIVSASGGGGGDRRGDDQSSLAAVTESQGHLCRPWDRADFMKRLATFKSISWFAKPKRVSAVNCARRGWINVDVDTIACEECGARLLFSTPASWNHQQVEKAALVFSLKLDNGHKLLCPWIDNACSETVARFPPTSPPVLVDNYRERCSALSQLSALPRISSSTIDHMQSPLLDDFLGQSLMQECENGSFEHSGIEDVSSQEELKLYYQAQRLISLCGWELRSLPYAVDCKDVSNQSHKNSTIIYCPQVVDDATNKSLIVYSADNNESSKVDENSKYSIGEQMDPNSVVFDCSLCGATVGLWAFCTVPRPVQSIRLVGYAELNGENDVVTQSSLNKNTNDLENRQGVNNAVSDVANSSKGASSSLNMTIAGGPPPTKQNFKAIISLPVIGQNLRARLSYDYDIRDHFFVDLGGSQSHSQIRIQEITDNTVNTSIRQLVPVSSEIREISNCETDSQASIRDSVVDNVLEGTHSAQQPSSLKDKMPVQAETDRSKSSSVGDPSSSKKNLAEDEALSVSHKTKEASNVETCGVKERVENPTSSEGVHNSLGKFKNPTMSEKAMEFDPIRQHRHFCPWIASDDDGEPGWKQTLSALYRPKEHSQHSPNTSPSSMPIIKVDDPVGSIRKLFKSPPTRRTKLTHISSQNAELG